jgi:hypothetical protein
MRCTRLFKRSGGGKMLIGMDYKDNVICCAR